MNEVQMLCPAKINRTLFIGNIQKNGLHEIESEMQKIDMCDELKIQKTKSGGIVFSLQNPHGFDVPADESNIVLKSARLFFANNPTENVSIDLIKNIPSTAGLGGGSSDSAGTLLALQKLFPELNVDIFAIASALGSDIPFFLYSGNRAMVTGTGEKMTSLPKEESQHIAIVKPKHIHISTAWAYAQWDKSRMKKGENHFESVVFSVYPQIQEVAETFTKSGGTEVRLCGSGSSVYGIFPSQKVAESAIEKFDDKTFWKWTGKTLF